MGLQKILKKVFAYFEIFLQEHNNVVLVLTADLLFLLLKMAKNFKNWILEFSIFGLAKREMSVNSDWNISQKDPWYQQNQGGSM